MDFVKKIFTPFFTFDYNWYNTFFRIRIFPYPDPEPDPELEPDPEPDPELEPESSSSLYTLDSKYYQLTKNIRNYNVLTHDEMKFINTLSHRELMEIILIYDLHTQLIKPFILENM
jgi:hypothetical protein